jgi:tetratricopeptide (TPR) repeat protein
MFSLSLSPRTVQRLMVVAGWTWCGPLLASVWLHSWCARWALARSRPRLATRQIRAALGAAASTGLPDVAARTLLLASEVLERSGDLGGARECADRAHVLFEDPLTADGIQALRRRGETALRQGDWEVAERLLREAVATVPRGRHGHQEAALAWNALGVVGKYQGHYDEAEAAYRRSEAHLAQDRAGRLLQATLAHNLGGLAFARGDHAGGEEHARRAVGLRTRLLGGGHVDVVADRAARAALLAQQGRLAEAAEDFAAAMAVYERLFGLEHPEWAVNANNLGVVEARRGHPGRAEELLLQALAVKEKVFGPDAADVATTLVNLVDLYIRRRTGQAEQLLERAEAIASRRVGLGHPLAAAVAERRARLAAERGRAGAVHPARETPASPGSRS